MTQRLPMTIKYSIQKLGGMDCILLQDGPNVHQIPVDAISTWGVLLGLTDEAEIIQAIVRDADETSGNIDWNGIYDALGENLVATSTSGVPAEYVEDLLDPELGSPIPGLTRVEKLNSARDKAKANLGRCKTKPLSAASLSTLVDQIDSEKVKAKRVEFIDAITPVIENTPPLPPDWNEIPTLPNNNL